MSDATYEVSTYRRVLRLLADPAEVMDDLKRRMRDNDISQNALARHLGVDPALVSRWFSPRPPVPGVESLMRVTIAVDELVLEQREDDDA